MRLQPLRAREASGRPADEREPVRRRAASRRRREGGARAQVRGDEARVLEHEQARAAQDRPPLLHERGRRRAVALVEGDLRLGAQRVPVLDVVALRRPAALRLGDLLPGARWIVVEQPGGVGDARAQRRRRVDRAAIHRLAQAFGRHRAEARQLAEIVEALEGELPRGVQLPHRAHALFAKDARRGVEVADALAKPAEQVTREAAS